MNNYEGIHTLVGIDIQNDFITGKLANPLAQKVMPKIIEKVKNHKGPKIFTQDTHYKGLYECSMEGSLPMHCCPAVDPNGWEIAKDVWEAAKASVGTVETLEKESFGCLNWENDEKTFNPIMKRILDQSADITVIGFVSEICVIANLIILRAMFPDKRIIWDSTCSAGIPNEKGEQPGHEAAKAIARAQMIEVIE
jgi:nicotinamidase-related amidase